MESLWDKRRCLGLAHLIDRTLARDSMIQSIGGARDARIAREVVAALRRASRGADVLPKARGQHARRGVKVSLSVDASLRAHEDSLLASGRWARVPETQATEKEEEEQEETVIVCGGGIASCDDDDQEEDVIVCGGATASRDFVPTVLSPTSARKFPIVGHAKVNLRQERQKHRANHNKPHALNSVIREKLEHMSKSKVVRSLPLQIDDARVDGRDEADSVKKRKVEHWYGSEEGRAWLAKRSTWSAIVPPG